MSGLRDNVPRLPHAAPFLLLDRVVEVSDRAGAFLKLVTAADPCVGPDGVLPASFLLEALAQGGGALLGSRNGPQAGYLAAVDDFRTLGDVRAGDVLRIEVEVLRHFAGAVLIRGRVLVGDELRAEGRVTLALPR